VRRPIHRGAHVWRRVPCANPIVVIERCDRGEVRVAASFGTDSWAAARRLPDLVRETVAEYVARMRRAQRLHRAYRVRRR
jgi:hypothetical protein